MAEVIDMTLDSDDEAAAVQPPVVPGPPLQPRIKADPGKAYIPRSRAAGAVGATGGLLAAKREHRSDSDSDCVSVSSLDADGEQQSLRPAAKRAKAGDGDDDELEVVGTTGTALPHLRCHCPDNPFDKEDNKANCELCFCYVCDEPAKNCQKWDIHCNASDTGATAYHWRMLRDAAHAKPGSGGMAGMQRLEQLLAARRGGAAGGVGGPVPPSAAVLANRKPLYKGHEVQPGWTETQFLQWHWGVFGMPANHSHYEVYRRTLQAPYAQNYARHYELGYPRALSQQEETRRQALRDARCACEHCRLVRGFYCLPAPVEEMVQYNMLSPVLVLPRLSAADKAHVLDVSNDKASAEAALEITTRGHYEKATVVTRDSGDGTWEVQLRVSRSPSQALSREPLLRESDYSATGPGSADVMLLGSMELEFAIKLRGEARVADAGTEDTHGRFFRHYVGTRATLASLQALIEHRAEHVPLPEPFAYAAWAGLAFTEPTRDKQLYSVVLALVKEKVLAVGVRAAYDAATNRGTFTLQLQLRLTAAVTSPVNAPQLRKFDADERGYGGFVVLVRRLLFGPSLEQPEESEEALKAWCGTDVQRPFSSALLDGVAKFKKPPAAAAAAGGAAGGAAATPAGGGASGAGKGQATPRSATSGGGSPADGPGGSAAETPPPPAGGAAAGGGDAAADGAGSDDGDDESKGDEEYERLKMQLSYGKHANTDVSLNGLLLAGRRSWYTLRLRDGAGQFSCAARGIRKPPTNTNVAGFMQEIENLGHKSLPEQPEELTVTLYEHQRQDVQWMLEQEQLERGASQHLWAPFPLPQPRRAEKLWFSPVLNAFTTVDPASPKGGILCDEMGLGKTAATLALHLLNRPTTDGEVAEWGPKDTHGLGGSNAAIAARYGQYVCKGTLVVCAMSLVGQWVEEAKRLCGGALQIYPYHGSRIKDPKRLSQYDVIVTTYGVVEADARRTKEGAIPPLLAMNFWRIVLDESHTIKTANKQSCSVGDLIGNRRWLVSGTPCNTTLSDLVGQYKFMGINNMRGALAVLHYQDQVDQRHLTQAMPFLRATMMRHTQQQRLAGLHILGLPPITKRDLVVKFSPQERAAYNKLEKVLQDRYRSVRYRLRSVKGSHSMAILTLVSQYRQACSGGAIISSKAVLDAAAEATGGDKGPAAIMDALCPICKDVLDTPAQGPCSHVFCHGCISAAITRKEGKGKCPKCSKVLTLDMIHILGHGHAAAAAAGGAAAEPAAAGGAAAAGAGAGGAMVPAAVPAVGAGPVKGEPVAAEGGAAAAAEGGAAPAPAGAAAAAAAGGEEEDGEEVGVVMESKLQVLVRMLGEIRDKEVGAKSLVFSQFSSTLRYLQVQLPRHGFEFRTLTGDMSRSARTKALEDFRSDPPTTIFLLSVRSGACGINLTSASHVFMLEPCLNVALEAQAVGRVHRLGQTRPVQVVKLYMENSIESRILDMQKQKAAEEGSGRVAAAGSIKADAAKELKIQDYNKLFNVEDDNMDVIYHAAAGFGRRGRGGRGAAAARARMAFRAAPPPYYSDDGSGMDSEGECSIM